MNIFENNQVEFSLDEGSLYDEVCFRYSEIGSTAGFSNIYRLHSALVPLHAGFSLRIKPVRPVPASLRDHVVLQRKGFGESVTAATAEEDGWYRASSRDLGISSW